VELLQFKSEMNAYSSQLAESEETVQTLRKELEEQSKKFEIELQGRQEEVETMKSHNSGKKCTDMHLITHLRLLPWRNGSLLTVDCRI
jgi:predicted RNase H-like nuclease (RuvC/YqgF family)